MADLLSIGVARLHSLLKSNASSAVQYRRGAEEWSVQATIGSGQHTLVDGSVVFASDAADFIIEADEFTTQTELETPRRGDSITLGDITYVVTPVETEPEWRYTTAHAAAFRIHAKKTR